MLIEEFALFAHATAIAGIAIRYPFGGYTTVEIGHLNRIQ